MNPNKVFVEVLAKFNTEGKILPVMIMWEDGSLYKIDKVVDVRPAPALRAGGQGDRYTVRINGMERYIFFERSPDIWGRNIGKWFVEKNYGSY